MQNEDLTQRFVETIKRRIFNGEYKIGDNFPSLRNLAQEFDCSRSVINVGIARLAAQGYLLVQKRQKTITNDFINEVSMEIIKDMALSENSQFRKKATQDILKARKLIEIQAVMCAAKHSKEMDLKELSEIIENEEKLIASKVKDYNIIAENDYKFHYHLTKISSNMVYCAVMESFKDTALKMTKRFYKNNIEYFERYVKKHKLIAHAIGRQDSDEAAKILEEILMHGERLYKNLE